MLSRPKLPIDALLPRIVHALFERAGQEPCNLVIEAPPGAGKTTGVPLALLDAGVSGQILVLQPRRIAARLAATRVASVLGERPGERCGYQVRFESAISAQTRIVFMTEGLLSRRLRDPREAVALRGVSTVILDEFHERHLEGDVVLALLRRLQQGPRPDLRIVAMSATLDSGPLCRFLGCAALRAEGRSFPVEIEYLGRPSRKRSPTLAGEVQRALENLFERSGDQPWQGHILVFLPGMAEIRACERALASIAKQKGLTLRPLHGGLDRNQQELAVGPHGPPKLILSTNVAESSVTIDGVVAVIDSGVARIASHDPWSGLQKLELAPISQASAIQRAGRAGRTQPGRCLRLYSKHDLDRRPTHDTPEVRRADLSGSLLDIAGACSSSESSVPFTWFEPPPEANRIAAQELLVRLGALKTTGSSDTEDELLAVGRDMLRYPLHPRAARLMVAGRELGIESLALQAAALLSERPLRTHARAAKQDLDSDLMADIELLTTLRRQPGSEVRLGIDPGAAAAIEKVCHQLRRHHSSGPRQTKPDRETSESRLLLALLLAFPDRVARIKDDGHQRRTLYFSKGGFAPLSEASVVRSATWVVALAVEDRRDGTRRRKQVRSASTIEPEWLLDHFPERVSDREEFSFDRERACVVGISELRFEDLVLESSKMQKLPAAASSVLAVAAQANPSALIDMEAFDALNRRMLLLTRLGLASRTFDETRLHELFLKTLTSQCEGHQSFAEVRKTNILAHYRAELGDDAIHIDRLLPTTIRLPNGRQLQVHYEVDRDPWIAARLQDFFGMQEGPTLLNGKVSVVMRLRAPNNRDVQVTTDLIGFWDRHYPSLRKTLMRRYPRHAWPEDPRSASPPTARPARRPKRR